MKQYVFIFTGCTGHVQIQVKVDTFKWIYLVNWNDPVELVLYSEPPALNLRRMAGSGSFSYLSLDEFEVLRVMSI